MEAATSRTLGGLSNDLVLLSGSVMVIMGAKMKWKRMPGIRHSGDSRSPVPLKSKGAGPGLRRGDGTKPDGGHKKRRARRPFDSRAVRSNSEESSVHVARSVARFRAPPSHSGIGPWKLAQPRRPVNARVGGLDGRDPASRAKPAPERFNPLQQKQPHRRRNITEQALSRARFSPDRR